MRRGSFLRSVQRALFAFAFVAFVYCAYVMTESWIFQREEDRNLERLVVAHQTAVVDDASPVSEPGGLVGRITVVRLGVSVIVIEGTDERTLRRAAGHIPGTALPGQQGNVGIAAHRDTFFRPLRDIRKDDVVTIHDLTGGFSVSGCLDADRESGRCVGAKFRRQRRSDAGNLLPV